MNNKLLLTACTVFACSQMAWAGAAKHIYVLFPATTEWNRSVPLISLDGGDIGKPMTPDENRCGWFKYDFAEGEVTDNVVFFRDEDVNRDDVIGANGNWETSEKATPIALSMIYDLFALDTIFFVADENQKTNEDGFYASAADVVGIDGFCTYNMAALIYDTDASLHPAFSCYAAGGKDCQVGVDAQGISQTAALAAVDSCIGVTFGLVETTLNAKKKPTLTKAGEKCFIKPALFNQLFTVTPQVNDTSCVDIPFLRTLDGMWEFDSDFYISPGHSTQGGFYPVEGANTLTKRPAEGPVFYSSKLRALDTLEGASVFDIACNGPAWSKGRDCTGQFVDEAQLETFFKSIDPSITCVMGWSCPLDAPESWQFYEAGTEKPLKRENGGVPRWTSEEGRNQHFCMESHTKFTYKPGLKFSFRASDDLWVFVDNKIAVDLGGTHLPAPAYVDLSNFEGVSGALVPQKEYDLDIFFCDRRTPTNSLRIKTNVFLMEPTAISVKPGISEAGTKQYGVCYRKASSGSCGSINETVICDSLPGVSYTLVNGVNFDSPAVEGFDKVTAPGVYKCGFDLTDMAKPKIKVDDVCQLTPGIYTLIVNVNGNVAKVGGSIRIGDPTAIKARPVVANAFNAYAYGNSISIVAEMGSSAKYVVLNALGSVVRTGNLQQGRAVVPGLTHGSYIVRIGGIAHRVNVK